MVLDYLHKAGWFLGLILLQVLILNNVHVAGYATPFLYIYVVLRFRSDISHNTSMLLAFILGLAVDVFSDTPGMNAAATVLLAFVRPFFLRLFVSRESTGSFVPSVHTMGFTSFLKYVVACVLLHHTMLIGIAFLSVAHIGIMLLSIVCSAVLTTACVMALYGISRNDKV